VEEMHLAIQVLTLTAPLRFMDGEEILGNFGAPIQPVDVDLSSINYTKISLNINSHYPATCRLFFINQLRFNYSRTKLF
jgi:hypothetical protein